MNTVVMIGSSRTCPTAIWNWPCLAANDDVYAPTANCPSDRASPFTSEVTLTGTTEDAYYLLVTLPSSGYEPGDYSLRWRYDAPGGAGSATSTPSATISTGAVPSDTPSTSPSAPPTPASCSVRGLVGTITGYNGSLLVVMDPANPSITGGVWTQCAGSSSSPQLNTQPASVVVWDLGAGFKPGGVLRVTTCDSVTGASHTVATVVHVGRGCPSR